MARRLNYDGKNILAPMVRIGTLPTRLLALDNGADIVYTEEIIDHKLLQSQRIINDLLQTVDYVWNNGSIVFRTCEQERHKVVLQLGTSDADRALAVAKLVENDVAGIDINMGCPKEYSVKGGMGVALLSKPEKIKDILTTLVNGVSIPVTCKIRILPTIEETLELVKLIEKTGVAAVAVHGRLKDERPRHSNRNDVIRQIANTIQIPVIANGGSNHFLKSYEDIERFREVCGASSVMIARSAMWNVSIFNKNGMKPLHDLIKDYLRYAVKYDFPLTIAKYNVQQMMHEELETPLGSDLRSTDYVRQICALWNMEGFYDETIQARISRAIELNLRSEDGEPTIKRRRRDDGAFHIEIDLDYDKKAYSVTPKMVIYDICEKGKRPLPVYETEHHKINQMFHAVLNFEGAHYSATKWRISKKEAEQEAALVAIQYLNLNSKENISSYISNLLDRCKGTNPSLNGDSKIVLDLTDEIVNSDKTEFLHITSS